MTSWPSIDTQPHQRYRKRALTDTAYYKLIDTAFNRAQEGDFSIGSWADEHHHESFAVETTTYAPGADNLRDSFTDEELLNMQRRDETYQIQAEAAWERTRFSHPIEAHHQQSIDTRTLMAMKKQQTDAHYMYLEKISQISFRQPMEQTICSCINAAIQNRRLQRSAMTQLEILLEEKDEYEVYRDDQRYARDLDGCTIPVHTKDIRRLLERASRDEPAYICLHEHASSFTQTNLVPEIYTKDEINAMFYGVYGEYERNKEAFQMKLDGVYYPLNDSIS
ncbi:hypothetical protein DY000_02015685 [Brassica cretica]|uniref:Uncharacterized protein n=1 Tax=Brassica cretica TaxID=69181 RepID=A0ABQ7D6W2_BRACR|nr:hypothetical protein DY000_02015685 [Brassica cretica]